MKNVLPFTLILSIFFISGCSSINASMAGKNSKVKDFLTDFSKNEFFDLMEKERDRSENMVRMLKTADVANNSLARKYEEVETAYNEILDNFIEDIWKQKNILSFKSFNPNEIYERDLKEAERLGNDFINAGLRAQGKDVAVNSVSTKWAFSKIWTVIKEVHNRYLKYCKEKMENKIHRSKFKSWSSI
jgi:hypothetical protein